MPKRPSRSHKESVEEQIERAANHKDGLHLSSLFVNKGKTPYGFIGWIYYNNDDGVKSGKQAIGHVCAKGNSFSEAIINSLSTFETFRLKYRPKN